ncbi:MAG: ROK family protein, partial [Clostridia bacterium]|nr:ROK family protein [Clostridia bacterium]
LMSRVYEKPFEVISVDYDSVPDTYEMAEKHTFSLNGCRIGFDAGGSDRKVSAVVDGKTVYSEEVLWLPKINPDPEYHYNEILKSFKAAAERMPRVDAIGISSAGIYINNQAKVASLFMSVPDDVFDKRVKNIYIDAAKQFGDIPLKVANDGDVTALAGAMSLNTNKVLGIAMGTSEAAGYVDGGGCIRGWLNELAFVPVDFNESALIDPWSGDIGCGVNYFSQDAVIKLAGLCNLELDGDTPAKKLKSAQQMLENGVQKAQWIFEDIGTYLAHSLAYYFKFYDAEQVLILGRVSSGKGGDIIINTCNKTLKELYPQTAKKVKINLPDEKSRRVGQSIAAASLPII